MNLGKLFWKCAYVVYPPFLRALEKLRLHHERQPYLRGSLHPNQTPQALEAHLKSQGFENAILAWRDPGELLSLRKIDREIFQYHIRLFSDGQLCCHYEYSSEGNPFAHVTEKSFEPRESEFESFLGHYLVSKEKDFK